MAKINKQALSESVTNESERDESLLSPEKIETSTVQDDATVINYIMLARIYDLLCVIGDSLGKGEDVMNLINLHRQGQLMSPPPIIQSQDTEVKDEQEA
jgi:hypothetical protein